MNESDPEIRRSLEAIAAHHEPNVEAGLERARRGSVVQPSGPRRIGIAVFALLIAVSAGAFMYRAFTEGESSLGPASSDSSSPPSSVGTDGSTGRILFSVRDDADGSEDVYSMQSDGSDVQPLLNGDMDDSSAVWSPDGTRVAFVRLDRKGPCVDSNIYVANSDGSDEIQLTGDPADLDCAVPSAAPGTNVIAGAGVTEDQPAWSPDGTQIAFRSGDCGIKVIATDGSQPDCLTPGSDLDSGPIWSPDGSRIAFSSDRGLPRFTFGTEIWIMDSDGSNATQVTHDGAGSIVTGWSPDGTRLAYQRSVNHSDYSWDVWTIRVDGTGASQLTEGPGYDGDPVFSPDGRSIVFGSDRFGDDATVTEGENGGHAHGLDVYAIPVDGGDAARLTRYAPLTAWPTDWASAQG